jgi:eukaryotic-like serine/threonine-protein kinase
MTAERWQRIKELLCSALERDPAERDAFLAGACGGDDDLRREVESLLEYQSRDQSFLEMSAADVALRLLGGDHTDGIIGQRIGPYRLVREIGRGGMGIVYLATRDDEQYQHQVAIKLVKRGMDTDLVLRRFRNERQILANLTHAHIAALLDGGTTDDGLPYFVMAYVDGTPIDDYCDAHRLGIVERLKLFRTVCGAVQYAHRNLVVHRDLKPSNILVTAEGVPKLLDFGISKLLDVGGSPNLTDVTFAAAPMTPEYASPEQARGEPVTVVSDVYSLGVLLYELLTGHRPYHFTSTMPQDFQRVINEAQPEKPSTVITRAVADTEAAHPTAGTTPEIISRRRGVELPKLKRQLRGDLDNLVLMAMRKEPERRYASVEQFSDDIRRHLECLPIRARPDTVGYRSVKFVERNRLGLGTAILILLILVASIVTTTRSAVRAERRFNDVRTLANSFMFEFHDAIKDLPGATAARELVVRRALEYLDSLSQEAKGDASLQLELAVAYQRIGDVQGNYNFSNLGDSAGALASYRKAASIHEAIVAAHPADVQARRDLAVTDIKVGDMFVQLGDAAAALDNYRKSLAISEEAYAVDPAPVVGRRNLALSHHKVGNTLMSAGDMQGAYDHHRRALALREALSKEAPTVRAHREVSISYERLSKVRRRMGDLPEALDFALKSMKISEDLSAADPNNAEARRDVGVSHQDVGLIQMTTGDLPGALDHFRASLAIDQAMAVADPKNAAAQRDVAFSHSTVGEVLAKMNDHAGAAESHRQSIAILDALASADPDNAGLPAEAAQEYAALGDALLETGDINGAIGSHGKALSLLEAAAATKGASVDAHAAVAASSAQSAALYAELGSRAHFPGIVRLEYWRTARSFYARSLDILTAIRRSGSTPPESAPTIEEIMRQMGICDAALTRLQPSGLSVANTRR